MSDAGETKRDNKAALDEVCALLQRGHRRHPNHTPSHTLNRLFKKDLGEPPALETDTPMLTPENVTVTLEKRPKSELCKLVLTPGPSKPKRTDVPVVIVHYRGKDRLIDGHNRCRLWKANGETGDHDALIITVNE
jgi:hypothetical protein